MSLLDNRTIYHMPDDPESEVGMLPCSLEEAWDYNSPKYKHGIFMTVNQLDGTIRKKDRVTKILAWAVDIDRKGPELWSLIARGPKPTTIIESKNGVHLYFDADSSATVEGYTEILEGMIGYYGGDKNAKDITRVLRVPGFAHWKNPEDPYWCTLLKKTWFSKTKYSEKEMLNFFKAHRPKPKLAQTKKQLKREVGFLKSGALFDRVYAMDAEEGLIRLSGTEAVNGDEFTFKLTQSGNKNIFVNGKGTSCFIDSQKLIGSFDGGGPTVWQWVNWYHHDHKKTHQIMKQHFPELFEINIEEGDFYGKRKK